LAHRPASAIRGHRFVGGFAGANDSRGSIDVNAGFSVPLLAIDRSCSRRVFQTGAQHQLRPLTVPQAKREVVQNSLESER
jgi:hypothetical protein